MTDRVKLIANTLASQRALAAQYIQRDMKHNHAFDYGYPDTVEFEHAYATWRRNGFAKALVGKTTDKTWQDAPVLREKEETHDETVLEAGIRERFDDIRVWQAMKQADARSMVGRYAGLLFRLRDGRQWSEPVGRVARGVDGLVEVVPAWEGQLTVSQWDNDPMSETFGQPQMFLYDSTIDTRNSGVSHAMEVHPDRVYIWSEDGTVHGQSKIEACYNALLDMEKIRGAGGEGFWKNAKSQPVLSASPDVDMNALAAAFGVELSELADELDAAMERFNRGFDQGLFLQGMDAKTLGVTLPSPEHFFNVAVQEVAASWPIPQKILVGMQTGERASTEDANEWSQIIMARRAAMVMPNIRDVIRKLERFGVLPDRDWFIQWADLTEATLGQKFDIAAKMADINSKSLAYGEVAYTIDEIREVTEYEPLTGDEGFDENEATDDPAEQDEPGRADGQDTQGQEGD